jgi:hypothetical protein
MGFDAADTESEGRGEAKVDAAGPQPGLELGEGEVGFDSKGRRDSLGMVGGLGALAGPVLIGLEHLERAAPGASIAAGGRRAARRAAGGDPWARSCGWRRRAWTQNRPRSLGRRPARSKWLRGARIHFYPYARAFSLG